MSLCSEISGTITVKKLSIGSFSIDLTSGLIGSGTSGLGTGSYLDHNNSGFNFFSTPNLELPIAEVVKLNNRYYPKDGDQCWANMECSGNKEFYFILFENEYFKKVLIKNEKNS